MTHSQFRPKDLKSQDWRGAAGQQNVAVVPQL
jgi:hypothetical protein